MTLRRSVLLIAAAAMAACLSLSLITRALAEDAGAAAEVAQLDAAAAPQPDAPTPAPPPVAAEPTPADPPVASSIARWWRTGALAGPIAVVLLVVLVAIRQWVPILRRGRWRAWISLGIAGLSTVLPAAANGSLTLGGLVVALTGAGVALKPGDGEAGTVPVAAGAIGGAP